MKRIHYGIIAKRKQNELVSYKKEFLRMSNLHLRKILDVRKSSFHYYSNPCMLKLHFIFSTNFGVEIVNFTNPFDFLRV